MEIGAPPQHKQESLRNVLLRIETVLGIANKERKDLASNPTPITLIQSVPGPAFEQKQVNAQQTFSVSTS